MRKNKIKGFTLIEVLVALMILIIAYTVIIHLHSSALLTYEHAKDLWRAVSKLELFMAGEPVSGVKTESHTFKVKGYTITEKTYTIRYGNATAYFRIYE